MHSTTESLHSNMSAVTYQRYHVQSSEYVQMTRMPKPSWRSSSAQVRPLEVRTMSATSRSCRRFPASSKAKLAKQQKALPAVFVHVTCCILVAVAVLPIATFVVRGCVDASRGTTGSSDAKPGFSRHCSRLRLGSEKFCAMRPRGRGQLAGQVGGAGEGKPGTEGRRRAFWRFLTTAIQAGDCYLPREEGFLGAEGGKERRFDMVTASFTQLGWLVLSNLHCCRGRACMLHMSG